MNKDDIRMYTTSNGSVLHELKLTLKNIPFVGRSPKEEELRLACRSEFCQNMAALIDNKSSADVKILTKDKTEIFVHMAILRSK